MITHMHYTKTGKGAALAALLLITIEIASLIAEPRQHRLGALILEIDEQAWRVTAEGAARWTLESVGGRDSAPVRVAVEKLDGAKTCHEIAVAQFGHDLYAPPQISDVVVAGFPAVRLAAHTRCRNATPLGVVICIPHGGWAHLIASPISGCRNAGNPFTNKDTVDLIAARLRKSE